jgi:hypothetical protein
MYKALIKETISNSIIYLLNQGAIAIPINISITNAGITLTLILHKNNSIAAEIPKIINIGIKNDV